MLKKLLAFLFLLILSFNSWASNNPKVRMVTNKGTIEITLNQQQAPISVANFLDYVNSGFYSGTIFHRVIRGFMIQGGGFTTDFIKKSTRSPIANEAYNGLRNERGTIAMARTQAPHSATAQFFINTANNKPLNHTNKSLNGWGYTVFGRVTKGMDVVDAIEKSRTGSKAMFSRDAPQENIVIEKIELIK